MQVDSHKQYDKMWAKLPKRQQLQAKACLKLFLTSPSSPNLRLHQLKGSYYPQYSISAGGDLRIHFVKIAQDHIVLMMIGSHSQLY
jgi:mRNA-degrading endonuclease YafQ of YafQ-DinJ toxin-antitoxin module